MPVDPEGKVTSWNESAQRIFGWAAAEVLGRFLPIVHANRSDEFAGLVSHAIKDAECTSSARTAG